MPVANHSTRVYHRWVNGDERFYYQADANQLNDLLAKFARTNQEKKEVVLLPGPGTTTNFKGDRKFDFNCEMHLVGGIARHIAGKDKGHIYWPLHPRLTIRVGPDLDLAALKIPAKKRP